ncbi:MAG: T9SS type A sorting domain-containing protein [Bacteroidetes bacterium]|nr:T9SS type A sorting domain-containing protein [Bacteroidota bacterium]
MKTSTTFFIAAFTSIAILSLGIMEEWKDGRKSPSRSHPSFHSESRTEAIDALQFLSASYAYPNNDVPPDAFGKAYDFYKKNFLNSQLRTPNSELSTGSWQNIGPNNVGGRTLCVALDPNDTATVWLGSASGGLWKSTTGGIGTNVWTYVPTGFPTLGVSSISFQPGTPQTIIIGTGETYAYGISTNGLIDRTTRGSFGIGMLKSTDGGVTWSQVLNWTYQQNRGVWDIKFNPLKPSIVYAATTEGIYKSYDSGNSWTQIKAVQMAMQLLIDPVDTNIIYCGVGNLSSPNKGLYKTSNSGSTWSILTTGLPSNNNRDGRIILAMNPLNHKTVLAHVCDAFNTVGFYITHNQGTNWSSMSPQDIASWQGWYAKGLLFDPADTTHVLAAGVDVHSSNDEGNNFAQVSNNTWTTDYCHSDVHEIIVNPQNANKIYLATDGGLFRSNDFGVSYYECTSGYVTTQFYIGAVSAQDATDAFAGAQDNYSWQYAGNPSWTSQIGGDGCYTAIDPTNDNNMFGAYQYLNVEKSIDRGANFNQVINSPSSAMGGNPTAFLAPYLLCPSNPQVMYAGGDTIIKSTNGGNSWNMIGPKPLDGANIILSIGVSSKNKDSLYVGTAPTKTTSHIFRSTNGGTNFTNVTGANLPNRYPRRITVDPVNSKIVYVVYSGFGTGHLFKSTNAGGNWTDISTALPDIPFHCLAIDPQNTSTIFAGCDLGIFYSNDGGSTWNTFNTGLPEAVMVFDLVVSPSDKTLLAFTHGHGVYKRNLSDAAVAVNDAASSEIDFQVYPNPSNGKFQVTSSKLQVTSMEVYTINGEKIYATIQPFNHLTIDVALPSGTGSGIYFLVIKAGKETAVKKIVISR